MINKESIQLNADPPMAPKSSQNNTHNLTALISELSKLPGLGERSAERLAFHLLKLPTPARQVLADAIIALKDVSVCKKCGNFVGPSAQLESKVLCNICIDSSRDQSIVCVVEQPEDLWKIEKTGIYKGVYHVLHGAISPLDGIGPENINLKQLVLRIREKKPREIILSTNPTAEGDNTALYIQRELKPFQLKITRLGRGIPSGSSIEYLNKAILIDALRERKEAMD
jgi:recombination protein RecR